MDVMEFDLDEEEDLSTVLGAESLAARDMVPEGFDNTLRARGVLELTQLGRWYTTRPYTGRQAQAGRELRPGPGRPACLLRALPRDKIYALLNLAEGRDVRHGFFPDYSNCLQQVHEDFIKILEHRTFGSVLEDLRG
jgi:hypothetical protein